MGLVLKYKIYLTILWEIKNHSLVIMNNLSNLSKANTRAFNKFPEFFVEAFKIVVDSWKFSMLLLYILWDDWPVFMISGLNQQLQHELEYTLLKPDCHSRWISKMQSEREDTLEEWYAIKFCFKLAKNAKETYEMLQTAFRPSCIESSISGMRDSRKAESLWRIMRGVGGVRKSIHQSWLDKGLGLGLLCWGFKGVQEDILSEETCTLQIGSMTFLPGQHQSTTPSLSQTIWPRWASKQFLSLPIVETLLPVTFGYSLSSEAVVMRQLRRWKRLWRRSLTRSYKRTSMGPSRSWLER